LSYSRSASRVYRKTSICPGLCRDAGARHGIEAIRFAAGFSHVTYRRVGQLIQVGRNLYGTAFDGGTGKVLSGKYTMQFPFDAFFSGSMGNNDGAWPFGRHVRGHEY
jgi:hypothetical protein